ncbi:MAG: hypothetical protein P4M11_03055, partial [Candidatus Pacebacteria bacterium]|nr:hypothetical protein [Candidatus Paceibacterota bacterium]
PKTPKPQNPKTPVGSELMVQYAVLSILRFLMLYLLRRLENSIGTNIIRATMMMNGGEEQKRSSPSAASRSGPDKGLGDDTLNNFKFLYDTFRRPELGEETSPGIVGLARDGTITVFSHDATSKVLAEELSQLSQKEVPAVFLERVLHLNAMYEKSASTSLKYVLSFYKATLLGGLH